MIGTKAILFDLDGTLIDTTELILRCFDHAWQHVCGERQSRESLIRTFGMPLGVAMRKLLQGDRTPGITDFPSVEAATPKGMTPIGGTVESVVPETTTNEATAHEVRAHDDATVEKLLATYRAFNGANHDLIVRPFVGTQEVLLSLRSRGYVIGVVTSKSRELARRGLRLCALEDLIDEAVFLEDTTRHKPEPEPILTALERLNVAASQAAYIGDSFHDIVAGKAAGVKTIAAAWGPMPRAELEREQPNLIVESVTDLLAIFP